MEQNQLIPFSKPEFTALTALPGNVANWKIEADSLKSKADVFLAELQPIDFTKLTPEQLAKYDERLLNTILVIGGAFTRIEGQRKAGTAILDEVKQYTMIPEKTIGALPGSFKSYRDKIAAEVSRRNAIAAQEQAKELDKKQALIDARTYIARCIIDRFTAHAVDAIKRMHAKFYEQGAKQLEAYAGALSKWSPVLDAPTWASFLEGVGNPKPQLITPEQLAAIRAEVETEQRPKLEKEWSESMTRERDGLVELVPSRKMELERIAQQGDQAKKEADERIAREAQEREAQAKRDAEDKAQALEQAASVDSLNASFDVAAQSAPVVGMAKGTVVKKKYQPKSHKAHVAIIQWWVKERMSSMTLEELQTKLSFMRTAADKALNEGTVIEADGLEVVEDYSTRASSKKTA
jgi:hypothetical protein